MHYMRKIQVTITKWLREAINSSIICSISRVISIVAIWHKGKGKVIKLWEKYLLITSIKYHLYTNDNHYFAQSCNQMWSCSKNWKLEYLQFTFFDHFFTPLQAPLASPLWQLITPLMLLLQFHPSLNALILRLWHSDLTIKEHSSNLALY